MKIVIGDRTLISYPQGGGHWTLFLQYLLGLRSLGHDVTLLELAWSTGNISQDEANVSNFLNKLSRYGLSESAVVLMFPKDSKVQDAACAEVISKSFSTIKSLAQQADLLWNCCAGIRSPLLDLFERRVLLDLDPGHLQVSALSWDMDIEDHHVFLTVGLNVGETDCAIPQLGQEWIAFQPFVYLPMWDVIQNDIADSPYTSITHWNWGELWWDKRVISISKRDAYLRFKDIPRHVNRRFELAATIVTDDKTGDRALLR